jgi:GNAT superfamily N-acetyltransferase
MFSHEITPEFSATLEQQEAAYWSEYYTNAPAEVVRQFGLRSKQVGSATAGVAAQVDILTFNRVIGLGLEQTATENQLEEIIALYKDAGARRFFVQLSPHAEPEWLPEMLRAKGFGFFNNWAKLYRDIHPLPNADTDLSIRQIDAGDADSFAQIIVAAFDWPQALKPLVALAVGRRDWKHYMAYAGDNAVACGALFVRGECATLAFAATLPEHRGQGAQSALIARRFRDAAEAGCRWMLTETAEETPQRPAASFRNMRRHGFDVAYLRPNYLRQF